MIKKETKNGASTHQKCVSDSPQSLAPLPIKDETPCCECKNLVNVRYVWGAYCIYGTCKMTGEKKDFDYDLCDLEALNEK